ncbi:MAG TPA: ABC transporter substrate-binding protein, partial [Solirubrobacterales bacterium]|nr:ABC transporter substrate-binding protein [Solirubrobacterales bacterium]
TGFWNDEAVEAKRQGIPLRVFKVDEFGAPRYPELVLTTTRKELEAEPELVEDMVQATTEGYEFTEKNPSKALDDLIAANPSLEKDDTEAQLNVLLPALHPEPFKEPVLKEWAAWATSHELLPKPLDVKSAFDLG